MQAAARGVRVVALHVHHGLSRHADAWEAHGRRQCERWSDAIVRVEFVAARLTVDRRSGESIEAWARRRRYRALAEMAHAAGASWVLLAHHRRDQAETLLLQALRGGGLAGLASMPAVVCRDGLVWRRPWLDATRERVDDYLARHRLEPVVDETNDDARIDRNRLRLRIWPCLAEAFPQAELALARSAARAGDGLALLDEIAEADLLEAAAEGPLVVARWLAGTPARRSNLLRAWLRREQGIAPPASLIERLMHELPDRPTARWPAPGGELRLHRGLLAWAAAGGPAPARGPARETRLAINGPGHHPLPGWRGTLRLDAAKPGERGLAFVAPLTLELRERLGGERFQAGPGRPPRALKKQFQDAGVPAWRRDGPLVYLDGRLVFVPGLGLDARSAEEATADGPPRLRLEWRADATVAAPASEGPAAES